MKGLRGLDVSIREEGVWLKVTAKEIEDVGIVVAVTVGGCSGGILDQRLSCLGGETSLFEVTTLTSLAP